MPWVSAILRGQKVLAKAREDGSFDSVGGRVEIRYRPTDVRAYRAAQRNLERIAGEAILPDDTCVPGEQASPKSLHATVRRPKSPASASPMVASAGAWIVYADGACSGNPGPAGLGIVIVSPAGKIHEGYEYLGTATNNIAELTAISRATELVPSGAVAVVHTDSQYSIGVLSKGWKAKANQDLILSVKTALAKRRAWRLAYVPGHAGVPLNERADKLAREAVRTRSSSMPTADALAAPTASATAV
ncbi:MAG: ribonuclease HI [Polyangiaceae bacterium]|nr:ribonuclease HI [Polyangiaceae bacterium]